MPIARGDAVALTRELVRIAERRLPRDYVHRLGRFRHGPAAFKVDYALDGPIPWTATACARAGTVHIGGTLQEIAESERAPWRGRHAERPFVLLAQHSLFDPTRAPDGKHTAWAYCHVPNGSDFDMTERIEGQIERFAPGFGRRVLARNVLAPSALEARNRNLVGGDINGGAATLWRLAARPVTKLNPYATPARGVYLCSASTPPGGGVHGSPEGAVARSEWCRRRAWPLCARASSPGSPGELRRSRHRREWDGSERRPPSPAV